MKPIDADRLLEAVKKELRYAPTYIQAKVEQCIRDAPIIEPPPNNPLTLAQLQEMDGEIAWCKDCSRYGVIFVDTTGDFEGIPFFSFRYKGINFCWNIDSRNLTLYRRKPGMGICAT